MIQSETRRRAALDEMFTLLRQKIPGMFRDEFKKEHDKFCTVISVADGFSNEIFDKEINFSTQEVFPVYISSILTDARTFFAKPENADKRTFTFNYGTQFTSCLIRRFAPIHNNIIYMLHADYYYNVNLLNVETGEAEFQTRVEWHLEETNVAVPGETDILKTAPFDYYNLHFPITPNLYSAEATF
jgi:hypothetical protein